MEKCPYCTLGVHLNGSRKLHIPQYSSRNQEAYETLIDFCPACGQLIILIRSGKYRIVEGEAELLSDSETHMRVIYPQYSNRNLSPIIPERYRNDFQEASLVLQHSPRASAALSRRLLQQLLREEFAVRLDGSPTLEEEINFLASSNVLPSEISDALHYIRVIGNWAAHPIKSRSTGQILDVEPDEAEWLLDILEDLLDFRFVRPDQEQRRRQKYDNKKRNRY